MRDGGSRCIARPEATFALDKGAFVIDGNSNIEWAKVVSHLESCSCLEMCSDILTVTIVQSALAVAQTLAVATALEMLVTMIPSTTRQ